MTADAPAAPANPPTPAIVVKLLAVSAVLGVVVALGFEAFERGLEHAQHWLWHTVAGDAPGWATTVTITTVGGLVTGLLVRFLPGHGGAHPADGHGLLNPDPDSARLKVVLSVLIVGFVSLMVGASLGPEGALLPGVAGAALLVSRLVKAQGPAQRLLLGAALAALLAAMFGSPLAGVVPLLEMVPVASGASMALLVLPALTATATATITLQVLGVTAAGRIPFSYDDFHWPHLFVALLVGVVAGAAGMMLTPATAALRSLTKRLDRVSVVITLTVGGLCLGWLYVIGGVTVRFRGIPELLGAVAQTESAPRALLLAAVKLAATAWCLAVGFRGGKIFPIAYVGGTVGLALHLFIPSIPVELAWGIGMAAAMATALGTPVMAALIAASLMTPAMLPLALLGVVAAHTVYVLGHQLSAAQPDAPSVAAASAP
ncbi:MAG: chloride channel protein [Ilumatobacteraceae bacterium]